MGKTWRRWEMQSYSENLKGSIYLGAEIADARIILRTILEKQDVMVWTEVAQDRVLWWAFVNMVMNL